MSGLGLTFLRRGGQAHPLKGMMGGILDSCVGWYTFEDKSNTDSDRGIVYDKSGKGNDLRLYDMNYGWQDGTYDLKEGYFDGYLYMKDNGTYGEIVLSESLEDATIIADRALYSNNSLKSWVGLVGSGQQAGYSPIHMEYYDNNIISSMYGSTYTGRADSKIVWFNRDYYYNIRLSRSEYTGGIDNHLYINRFRGDIEGGGPLKLKGLYIFNRSLSYEEIGAFINTYIDLSYVMPTIK